MYFWVVCTTVFLLVRNTTLIGYGEPLFCCKRVFLKREVKAHLRFDLVCNVKFITFLVATGDIYIALLWRSTLIFRSSEVSQILKVCLQFSTFTKVFLIVISSDLKLGIRLRKNLIDSALHAQDWPHSQPRSYGFIFPCFCLSRWTFFALIVSHLTWILWHA